VECLQVPVAWVAEWTTKRRRVRNGNQLISFFCFIWPSNGRADSRNSIRLFHYCFPFLLTVVWYNTLVLPLLFANQKPFLSLASSKYQACRILFVRDYSLFFFISLSFDALQFNTYYVFDPISSLIQIQKFFHVSFPRYSSISIHPCLILFLETIVGLTVI
jgi:hypothetical protein